ncbi:MAG: hypothetical protein ABWK05_05935 [Pyrobaculum sp.]
MELPGDTRAAAEELTKIRAAPLLDLSTLYTAGKTPELHKWIRLRLLAGFEEAKKAYWLFKGLWPPPEPLQKGSLIKATVGGLEVYIKKWDAEGVELAVRGGGGLLKIKRTSGRTLVSDLELARSLGLNSSDAVDSLIKEAVRASHVAAREEVAAAPKPAAGSLPKAAVGGALLYKNDVVEVRLAGLDEERRPIFIIRHAAWSSPALAKPSQWGGQLRWTLYPPHAAPPETLGEVEEALEKIGAPTRKQTRVRPPGGRGAFNTRGKSRRGVGPRLTVARRRQDRRSRRQRRRRQIHTRL